MFFSTLIFGSSSFLPISSWARPIALSASDHLAVVVRTRRALLGFALRDLLLEILQLGASIERVLDLILPIELDDQIARRDGAARPAPSS